MTYLAWVYNEQARYTEARELAESVVKDARTLLGQAHRETLFAMVMLSIIYESEGRYDDAESLLLKAMEIRRKQPSTQPDWRWPEYQLGQFYLHCKRYEEAHDAFMVGIQTHRRSLGESHCQVRWTINDCANLWERQGRPEWAERYRALLPEKNQ
jgi:tetratricopeptide (TPR) repeat protein